MAHKIDQQRFHYIIRMSDESLFGIVPAQMESVESLLRLPVEFAIHCLSRYPRREQHGMCMCVHWHNFVWLLLTRFDSAMKSKQYCSDQVIHTTKQ